MHHASCGNWLFPAKEEPRRFCRAPRRPCPGQRACSGKPASPRSGSGSSPENAQYHARPDFFRLSRNTACSPSRFQNPPRRIEAQRPPPGIEHDRRFHLGADDVAEPPKILDGAEVDIGRVPPIVRKVIGARHVSAQQRFAGEFSNDRNWERYDAVSADAQHVLQHDTGSAGCLQRLREDDVVESVVGIVRQGRYRRRPGSQRDPWQRIR